MATLLSWTILFFILALIAYAMGARGLAGLSMTIAKWLAILFVVIAVITLLF